jgi:hypothetical protein
MYTTKYVHIKSTTVYAPRRNWDSPQPPTRRLVCPLPPVSGGRGTLAGEKGVGRVPVPTRGIHCGTLYMYVLCDVHCRYYNSHFYIGVIAVYGPTCMVWSAQFIMHDARKYITRASGRRLGPGNRDFFGPVKWHRDIRWLLFGAKKVEISKAQHPLPLAQVMYLPLSKEWHTGPFQSEVHR